MKFVLGNTPMALWYQIIHDAESTCAIALQQELESYLVLLLMRYMDKPLMVKKIMALELLQAMKTTPAKRGQMFQEIGDCCLIFSGLFPKLAEKRLVKIGYFVRIGRSAYSTISEDRNDLYSKLAANFVSLMDVLQSIKKHDLLPIEAYDLWNETRSQRALSQLQQYTSAVPFRLIKE